MKELLNLIGIMTVLGFYMLGFALPVLAFIYLGHTALQIFGIL